MADEFNSHQMESGEEIHRELFETNVRVREAELDDVYEILSEAEFNMAITPIPDNSEPSTTAGALSGSAPSTQEGHEGRAESDTESPSIFVESFMSFSLGSQRASDPSLESTGQIEEIERVGEMGWTERMAQLGTFAESVITEPMLTSNTIPELAADTGLEILESFPVVATKDLPEGYNDCPICQEAFENEGKPEVPVRLPCRHIFGKLCISKWLSNNTCPLCRASIYPPVVPNALARIGDVRELTLLTLRRIDGTEREDAGSSETRIRALAAALARQAEDLALVSSQRTALTEVSLNQIATLENILRDLRSLDS